MPCSVNNVSEFSCSLRKHQQLELLVGAPREKAESNVPANRTGGVYTCPVTAKQSDCRRIKLIDPCNQTPAGWQPISLHLPACGHRFIKVHLGQRWMTGHCYLHRNAQHQEEDLNWQNIHPLCVFSYRLDHLKEGMCTFGISASITQSDVILGSPGSYEWQGFNSFRFNSSDRISEAPSVLDKNLRAHVNPVSWMPLMGNFLHHAAQCGSSHVHRCERRAPRDNKMDARGSVMLIVKESTDLVIQKTLRGQQVGSYFGNAVVAVDLNSDGWNDLLVGAPFYFNRQLEVGGAVYVYMNGGGRFPSEPSMVLTGPVGSAFGMAIAAAGDLDQDGFQDFAVGAPFHDAGLVMIWTGSREGVSAEPSQVIHGSTVFPGFRTFGYSLAAGVDVDGNDYPDLLVADYMCFHILTFVCFCLAAVNLTVSADVTSLTPRLRFQNNGESMFSSILSVRNGKCKTLRVGLLVSYAQKKRQRHLQASKLIRNNNINALKQLLHTLVLTQNHLEPFISFYLVIQIHFQKSCGSDNVCQSNLHMEAQFTDENHEPFPNSIRRLLLEVNVSNIASRGRLAEDAHDTVLNVSIPPSLIYSGVQAMVLCWWIKNEQNLILHKLCSDWLLPARIPLDPIFFSGKVMGERAMKTTKDVGSFLQQVHILGKPLGHLGNLEVEFDWPKEVANGKWLLYLTEIRLDGTSNPRCIDEDIINPLNLLVSMTPKTLLSSLQQEINPGRDLGHCTVQLPAKSPATSSNCCSSGARCVKFSCPLLNVTNVATLTVRSRLWNSTMIEDYSDVSSVSVQGLAALKLRTTKSTISMKSSPSVNIYPESGLLQDSGAPLWIIVVSVLAGVLLLALICLLLWKCGFFKRASTRELYEAKTQRALMRSQPSDKYKLTEEL
uniref:Integrin, alpha 3a n=1 Tax=Cyprinodon variegatus TaxID=28743 RepID=A0A3Q2DMH7_CYPVA